ncbi:MAG: hypothetical protein VYC42_06740 [Pseudomonadota bacterium]|nr:hypothetical protein [Pseudomonadota bacterium]
MKKQRFVQLAAVVLVLSLTGCAMGQRREQIQQTMQFENVDTNADGAISRAEWDAMKAQMKSMKRF